MTAACAALLIALSLTGSGARFAEIAVLTVPPLRTSLIELAPRFESTSGHKLKIEYQVSAVFKQQIDGGKGFDLGIFTSQLTDDLIKQGKVVSATPAEIARAELGIAVRQGAAKPDIATVEGFKRTLLAAKSIAYSPQGTSGIHTAALLKQLGIEAEIKPKLIRGRPGASPCRSPRARPRSPSSSSPASSTSPQLSSRACSRPSSSTSTSTPPA